MSSPTAHAAAGDAAQSPPPSSPVPPPSASTTNFPLCRLPPVTTTLQNFKIYETQSRYILVGSDKSQTQFKILKLDRMTTDLNIVEDPTVYSAADVQSLLRMVAGGNASSFQPTCSAVAILGAVRFLTGYYLYLVTAARRVGTIGGHIVYTVEDTLLLPITNPEFYARSPLGRARVKRLRALELRYRNLFLLMDLTKNFYFSYTYDLTRQLQTQMLFHGQRAAERAQRRAERELQRAQQKQQQQQQQQSGDAGVSGDNQQGLHGQPSLNNSSHDHGNPLNGPSNENHHSDNISNVNQNAMNGPNVGANGEDHRSDDDNDRDADHDDEEDEVEEKTLPPKSMYVWNDYLLRRLGARLPAVRSWTVPVIHGFFEQVRVSVFGRVLTLTLLARRSRYFAGTRYLKRGINDKGHAANDVEAEQILHDRVGAGCDPREGQFTSHTQCRASIPLFWSQESNALVARPPILVTKVDPLHLTTRRHFGDLFARYGSPVLCLNLVKQHERRPREMVIGQPFGDAVAMLNNFLPTEHQIDYYAWDFKHVSRSKTVSVVDELAVIAHWALQRNGLFHSHPRPEAVEVTPERSVGIRPQGASIARVVARRPYIAVRQHGVCRCNCIDSLDRTNVAQFCIGKCALGYQLLAMGVTSTVHTDPSSELVNVLFKLYDRMGDALALQYGGSLMHKQMRKDKNKTRTMGGVLSQNTNSSKPKELLVSLMRHIQNSFQDTGKQDCINLFLGYFVPELAWDSLQLDPDALPGLLQNLGGTVLQRPGVWETPLQISMPGYTMGVGMDGKVASGGVDGGAGLLTHEPQANGDESKSQSSRSPSQEPQSSPQSHGSHGSQSPSSSPTKQAQLVVDTSSSSSASSSSGAVTVVSSSHSTITTTATTSPNTTTMIGLLDDFGAGLRERLLSGDQAFYGACSDLRRNELPGSEEELRVLLRWSQTLREAEAAAARDEAALNRAAVLMRARMGHDGGGGDDDLDEDDDDNDEDDVDEGGLGADEAKKAVPGPLSVSRAKQPSSSAAASTAAKPQTQQQQPQQAQQQQAQPQKPASRGFWGFWRSSKPAAPAPAATAASAAQQAAQANHPMPAQPQPPASSSRQHHRTFSFTSSSSSSSSSASASPAFTRSVPAGVSVASPSTTTAASPSTATSGTSFSSSSGTGSGPAPHLWDISSSDGDYYLHNRSLATLPEHYTSGQPVFAGRPHWWAWPLRSYWRDNLGWGEQRIRAALAGLPELIPVPGAGVGVGVGLESVNSGGSGVGKGDNDNGVNNNGNSKNVGNVSSSLPLNQAANTPATATKSSTSSATKSASPSKSPSKSQSKFSPSKPVSGSVPPSTTHSSIPTAMASSSSTPPTTSLATPATPATAYSAAHLVWLERRAALDRCLAELAQVEHVVAELERQRRLQLRAAAGSYGMAEAGAAPLGMLLDQQERYDLDAPGDADPDVIAEQQQHAESPKQQHQGQGQQQDQSPHGQHEVDDYDGMLILRSPASSHLSSSHSSQISPRNRDLHPFFARNNPNSHGNSNNSQNSDPNSPGSNHSHSRSPSHTYSHSPIVSARVLSSSPSSASYSSSRASLETKEERLRRLRALMRELYDAARLTSFDEMRTTEPSFFDCVHLSISGVKKLKKATLSERIRRTLARTPAADSAEAGWQEQQQQQQQPQQPQYQQSQSQSRTQQPPPSPASERPQHRTALSIYRSELEQRQQQQQQQNPNSQLQFQYGAAIEEEDEQQAMYGANSSSSAGTGGGLAPRQLSAGFDDDELDQRQFFWSFLVVSTGV